MRSRRPASIGSASNSTLPEDVFIEACVKNAAQASEKVASIGVAMHSSDGRSVAS